MLDRVGPGEPGHRRRRPGRGPPLAARARARAGARRRVRQLAAAGGRRTGMRSSRQAIWTELDPCRTLPVLRDGADGDPAEAWTRYALDAQVMLVHTAEGEWVSDPGMSFLEWLDKGEPGEDDLTYHLSTLFPPVRPRGWLELRMIDALPGPYWPVPVAVATALLEDPAASRAAEAAAEPVAHLWAEAARCGLSDASLAAAAAACFAAALEALPRLGAPGLVPLVEEYAHRYVERGRCPADDRPSLSLEDPT
nr:glutamate-cysteine ligase family protein [Actinomadura madurae]